MFAYLRLKYPADQLRLSILTILLVFSCGQFLSVDHVHDDGRFHQQCEHCVQAKHTPLVDTIATPVVIAPDEPQLAIIATSERIQRLPTAAYLTRAPPTILT